MRMMSVSSQLLRPPRTGAGDQAEQGADDHADEYGDQGAGQECRAPQTTRV